MKKINQLFVAIVTIFIAFSCSNNENTTGVNIYSDTNICSIAQFQYNRNTQNLISFLKHKNPEYRYRAAIAMASVQDSLALPYISALLKDSATKVRMAATFALGQSGSTMAAITLKEFFRREKSDSVKCKMLEAIGQCGSEYELSFLADLNIDKTQSLIKKGRAWGLARFGLRKMINQKSATRVVEILKTETDAETRYAASLFFTRVSAIDLSGFKTDLYSAIQQEKSALTKQNLLQAIAKIPGKESIEIIAGIAKSDNDYKTQVCAIKALSGFPYSDVKEIIAGFLSSPQVNTAIRASEFFSEKYEIKDSKWYRSFCAKKLNWRVNANMLTAAMAAEKDKAQLSDSILNVYKQSKNDYEKAALISALRFNFKNIDFIISEALNNKTNIIKTSAAECVAEMIRSTEYKKETETTKYVEYIKKCITSGDAALMCTAAGLIKDTTLAFKQNFADYAFLEKEMNKLNLPKDIETYNELKQTIEVLSGKKIETPQYNFVALNWSIIKNIKPNQQLTIQTEKGDITLELFVEQAPASVYNFLQLVEKGYYKEGKIHRSVPNFVVQDGCTRGDGWSNTELCIRSEFAMLNFEEGSLGMASSGKDTEGGQWFICTNNTPHLDGAYTNFAKVVKGMEVVHKLEVGDKITGYKIL